MLLFNRRSPIMNRVLRRLLAGFAFTLSILPVTTDAAPALVDVQGGREDPVVSRLKGSTLVGFKQLPFDQSSFPLSSDVQDKRFVKPQTVEGRITRLAYLAPEGKGVLESRAITKTLWSKAVWPKGSPAPRRPAALHAFRNLSSATRRT